MCTFIFVVLPEEVNLELVQPVFVNAGKLLRPAQQEDFHNVPGRVYYTTRGFCDCGTLLGCRRFGNCGDGQNAEMDSELDKLRRKGWSAAKIARWQKDKLLAYARRRENARQELDRWLRFLSALQNSSITPWLGLFHHFTGGIQDMSIAETVRVNWAEVNAEFLMQMQEDTLYQGATKHEKHWKA